jgi:hypothetical protein
LSVLLKTQTYITQAVRSATFRELPDGIWEASWTELDLTALGESRDDAELGLLAKVTDYVVHAERHGRSLPVIDGADLTSVVDGTSAWTDEWRRGVDEALAQFDAGEGEIFQTGSNFLETLDPRRAAAGES